MLFIGRVAQPDGDQDQEDEQRPGHFQQQLTCLSSSKREVFPQQQPQLRPAGHVTSAGTHGNLLVARPWRQRPELVAKPLWLVINCFPLLFAPLSPNPVTNPSGEGEEKKRGQKKIREQSAGSNRPWLRGSWGAPSPVRPRLGRGVSARLGRSRPHSLSVGITVFCRD